MRTKTRTLLGLVATLLLLTACAPTGDDSELVEPTTKPVYPALATYPDIPVFEDIAYGDIDGQSLDVCLPTDARVDDLEPGPRPVIVSIHGGSWMRGDKADFNWRAVCQWFASEGYVTVSVNYRLVPAATFPSQLLDVQQVVRWLRDPTQVAFYDLDPARIGAFGGSAGGNLAALLGTAGDGDLTVDSRVAAVAELSGPADLREPIPTLDTYNQVFADVQLAYVGCTGFTDCDATAAASPVTLVDPSDPPFFVGHSVDEFIPIAQSDEFVTALRAAGISTTYVTVEGSLHSIAMLDDDMMQRIISFFDDAL